MKKETEQLSSVSFILPPLILILFVISYFLKFSIFRHNSTHNTEQMYYNMYVIKYKLYFFLHFFTLSYTLVKNNIEI